MDSHEYAYQKRRENLEKGYYKSAHCENCIGGDCGDCPWNEELKEAEK